MIYDEMVKLYPELAEHHSFPIKVSRDDKVAILESPEGRKAVIIKWDNGDVTVLASKPGEKAFIHTAKASPEMFYIAQHFYDEQGLKIKSILEKGEEIGK